LQPLCDAADMALARSWYVRLTRLGMGVACSVAPALAQAPTAQSAAAIFREARSELAGAPATARAEYLAYTANQERAAGLDAREDWRAAFIAAIALARNAAAVKTEVELDAIEGLVDSEDWSAAESLAMRADAGEEEILDRLVPAELAAGRTLQAWSLWRTHRGRAGYPAAGSLLAAQGGRAGDRQALCRAGLQKAAAVNNVAQVEEGVEFISECVASGQASKASSGEALMALKSRLPKVEGAGWEIAAARDRLRAALQRVNASLLQRFDALPVLPPLAQRQRGGADGEFVSSPTLQAYTFEVLANGALEDWNLGYQAENLREAIKRLSPAVAASLPVAAVRVAVGSFELGRMEDARRSLDLALDEAMRRANRIHWGTPIQISGSAVLEVFGAAAEIDLARARLRAEALRPGPMKILVLARVARMAPAAARLRPGQPVALFH
jgi:hypothetical protein